MKLKPREKKIAIAVGLVLGIFIIDRLVLSPLRNKQNLVKKQISAMEIEFQSRKDIVSRKDQIEREFSAYKKYLLDSDTYSERDLVVKFLKEVESSAQESGLSIVNLNPQNEVEQDKLTKHKKYLLELRAESTLPQLVKFLSRIQQSQLLINLESFSITTKDEQGVALRIETTVSMNVP